eukprot:CAMPEP_0202064068 /NCGR_PEP_ID=MMETSP0963-20130614/48091_1 /ASSEMBLY_ACC=CAM_ASM_000494 /TAXON_ID=4773 /ORGANISM="Schizochytrium aggregatum, Strain ATCC28209" /LENGTH=55 /DNA_ID=CAMNT_0048630525 /DNA_START=111 /DNA_END=275 /DNA_ORIENTATION=-
MRVRPAKSAPRLLSQDGAGEWPPLPSGSHQVLKHMQQDHAFAAGPFMSLRGGYPS